MKTIKVTYIIIFTAFNLIFTSVNAKIPIWHGLLGGSYIFESHFNSNLQGFEINLNRHYSCCVSSNYLNGIGFNMLWGNNYRESGFSYTQCIFKNFTDRGFGGWNLIVKLNPNIVSGFDNTIYMVKTGIGATVYTSARTNFPIIQAFVLFNYDIFLQKNQYTKEINRQSVQLGVFIGLNTIQIRPVKFRRKNTKNNL